eukprot:XP_001691431.1 predicted protein [Chlamydomonas reinhardtii]
MCMSVGAGRLALALSLPGADVTMEGTQGSGHAQCHDSMHTAYGTGHAPPQRLLQDRLGGGQESSLHSAAGRANTLTTSIQNVDNNRKHLANKAASLVHRLQLSIRRRNPEDVSCQSTLEGEISTQTSVESYDRALVLGEAVSPEFGTPGWERALTQQIAACTGLSTTASSRRASESAAQQQAPLPGFGQVVLPQQLLHKAAEHGANLHIDLRRDVTVDGNRALGSGQFGTVFAGTYRGAPVAVKSLRPLMQGCTIDDLEVFVQEVTVLCTLRHPSIVQLLGACLQPPDICLVEELCATSLDAVLHRRDTIALDVALGMQYLHSRAPAVVHRDLKPSNILLDAEGRAKIGDFGLARLAYNAYIDTARPETGSMAYMAPECWDPVLGGGLTDKMDIFSYGVVLWELCTGERPWAHCRTTDFVSKVVSRGARLPVPTNDNACPYALRCLISSCTEERPSERPAVAHIVAELQRMLKYTRRTADC